MKRTLLLPSLLMLLTFALAAETITTGSGVNSVAVLSSSASETVLQYQIGKFDTLPVRIGGDEWFHINLPKEGITQDKGLPQLPVFNRSIIIDTTARMRLELFDAQYQDYQIRVAPSKGVITRNIDPATVPYTFGDVYEKDEFYPQAVAELSEPYIMRDFRGITVKTIPFAFNPKTGVLRVYTSYKIRVFANGLDTVNILTRERNSITRDFEPIYSNHFLNWENYRYTPVDDTFGKLLVICHTNYLSAIQPYVNWKIQKGIHTELIEWSTIGTTAAQLQTYIQNRYNADNNISYVQIVGDAPQIPSLSSGGGGADPTFSLVAGSDNYPDIFIGRFSAQTTGDVTAQINKAIVYERDLNETAVWLSKAMGIASSEGGGGLGDMGESDIAHSNLIRTDLLNYGYTTVDQIYDPGASASTVTTNINAGRGFVNYVGHGSDTTWGTTGFSNSNASALTNGNKTPFIVDVACVNGNFVSITCFAEAWQRNANGGSVAMYASSINQSWNSPMRAQDEVTDLLIAESKTTIGGLFFNGSCKMMDIYGSTSGSDGVNMFKTWHIFGDASLLARSKTPSANAAVYPAQIFIGQTEVEITGAAPYSHVAITLDGVIYGTALADASGYLNLPLTPFTDAGTATLVITALNKITILDEIDIIANDGPWMSVTATVCDDANNDLPDYNESGYLDVTFKNVGSDPASAVTAILTSATEGITITDNSANFASLAPDTATTIDNAYAISIADDFADGSVANFTITMTSGSDTWVKNFTLTINAPELAFGGMTVSDPTGDNDGLFDPGETVTLTIPLNNTGGAASLDGSGTVTCATTGITIINGSSSFTAIPAGGYATLSFTASAEASMAEGTLAPFVFQAAAGAYEADTTVNVEIGAPLQVIIGSGTSTQTYPIDRYYNYSSHEAIYLSTEIGTAGTIKSIAFHKASGSDVGTIEAVTIYMKNTTASTLATGTYSTTGYTQVYSGNWPNTSTSGWMEVNLDTLFPYDGTNLSILTIKGNQAYITNYPYWSYTNSSTTRARQARSDTSQPTSLTASNNQPNLMLRLFPMSAELYPAQNLFAEAGNGFVALSWDAPYFGIPSGYQIFRDGSLLTTVTGLTYTDSAVVNETTYSYYVVAVYNGEAADPSNTVQATPTSNLPVEATLGTGSFSTGVATPCPVNINYQSLHGQSVYTAAELNAAGVFGPVQIMKIGFNVTGIPTLSMPNYVIRMGHTTAINGASWIPAANLTQVWSSTSYRPTETGWNLLALATPFTWNGTDNIVVDTAFGLIGSTHASGQTQYTNVTTGYRTAVSNAADMTNVFSGGTSVSYRPNLRIAYMSEALAAPAVTIATSETAGVTVSWPAVPNAGQYQILRALEPYGTYEHLAYTEDLSYNDTEANDMAFYKVRALSEPPVKRTTKK